MRDTGSKDEPESSGKRRASSKRFDSTPPPFVLALKGITGHIAPAAQTATAGGPLGNIDSVCNDAQVNSGTNESEVIVEAANLATNAVVQVRIVPKFGMSQVVTCSYVGATNELTYWRAVARFGPGLSVLQARAVGQ